MRILVLAPHPFYQERGTPIAVDLLVRALSERGDQVDVLTFHEGEDRIYPNVRIHRISAPPGIRNLRPGPSLKKLICDLWMFVRLIRLLRKNRYDVLHCVEESVYMAMVLRPFFGFRYVYDMDSSLASQVLQKYRWLRPFGFILRWIEAMPIRRAEVVVPVCEALADRARKYRLGGVTILRDVSLLDPDEPAVVTENLRSSLGIEGTLSAYIGNLEKYQGIDLMLKSFAEVRRHNADAHLVVIGGEAEDISHYENETRALGIHNFVHFIGKRPLGHMAAYMQQADILLSPRTAGENTPMKVYSYLHSGVPVLATDLPTHTQVMTPEIAKLAAPVPDAYGAAWIELINNKHEALQLAKRARRFIEREHSYSSFATTLYALYTHLEEQYAARQDSQPHHTPR